MAQNEKARRYDVYLRASKSLISKKNSWCPEAESNHRHGDFQSPALPTELSGQVLIRPFYRADLNEARIKPASRI